MIKTTSNELPRGYKQFLNDEPKKPHFDDVYSLLAQKHYGKYLIIINKLSNTQPHSRLYLCHDSMLELMKSYASSTMVSQQKDVPSFCLFTLFPKKIDLTWVILSKIFDNKIDRYKGNNLCGALGKLYEIYEKENIPLNNIDEFSELHVLAIEKHVKKYGGYNAKNLRYLTELLKIMVVKFNLNVRWPNLTKYGAKINRGTGVIPTLSITWQLDYFAELSINSLIKKVKQYQLWMKELKEIGELFSMKNLAYTFFENIDTFGRSSGGKNFIIRKLAQQLFNVELQCWKSHFHIKEDEQKAKNKLRKLGTNGININITGERMYAMWHKTIAENYPFEMKISDKYSFINKNGISSWGSSKNYNDSFNTETVHTAISPSFDQIYPLYLLVLCRTGMNPGVIQDWRVYQNEKGIYKLGVDSAMGRIVDGHKGRGNSEQTAVLDRQLCKFVDFYTEWLTPLFNYSKDNHFFQYMNLGKKNNLYTILNSINLSAKRKRKQGSFYHMYPIKDEIILTNGKQVEEQVMWIQHDKLRQVKNLSEYLDQKNQYIRKMQLGHKNLDTEYIYQQSVEFQDIKGHQIALAQNQFLQVAKGEANLEETPRLKIFSTPMANCKNPHSPTYQGVKKLHKHDVCTNWRKCLTECDQSDVVDKIHGPVIMAWKTCMDDIRKEYQTIELWEREFFSDYQAALTTLEGFEPDILKFCKKESLKYTHFVKGHILNSRHSRNIVMQEQVNG